MQYRGESIRHFCDGVREKWNGAGEGPDWRRYRTVNFGDESSDAALFEVDGMRKRHRGQIGAFETAEVWQAPSIIVAKELLERYGGVSGEFYFGNSKGLAFLLSKPELSGFPEHLLLTFPGIEYVPPRPKRTGPAPDIM